MTTRRGRSSGSSEPGSQAFRRGVQRLKRDLTEDDNWSFERLEIQDRKLLAKWQPLTELAESLQIEELLAYMNDNLLEGQGVIEKTFRWERSESDDLDEEEDEEDWEDDEEDDEDEDEDDWEDEDDEDDDDDMEDVFGLAEIPVLSILLSWKQAGRIQLNVELVGTDDGIVLRVNGDEMGSPTPRFLYRGLIGGFEEHTEFIETPDDDEEDD